MADSTDWTDPCQAAAALRVAYFEAMSGGGGQVTRIRFGDREVAYSNDPGAINALREELARQQALCDIKQGKQPARRAIRFGSYRSPLR